MIRSAVTKLSFAVLCLSLAGTLGCRKSAQLSTTAVTEPAGANCAAGGLAVRTGEDLDGDGLVAEKEAISTHYVCNGTTGTPAAPIAALSKVTPEPAGANCTLGGYLLQSGNDTNDNDVLDAAEVTSSDYLCAPETNANLVLLNKTFIGNADAQCAGGYVRIGYGVDTNGDGTLSSTEQTSSFVTCNLLPRVTSSTAVIVADCTQSPIVLPITSTDLDGRVTQTAVQVLQSGSQLVFSSGPNGEVRLSPGAHVAGAVIEVTLTDDLGATSTTHLRLVFSGTGCTPLASFHGVFPDTCVAVEVSTFAGDDRSGPVLTRQGVYYNGDQGLMRTGLDLENPVRLVDGEIDYLMGDAVEGRLLSLWSSGWDAVLPDGGVGPGITGLRDPDAGQRFFDLQSPEPLDQIAVLDETTLQPTARFALPQPIVGNGSPFTLTAPDGGVYTMEMNKMLISAAAGQALVMRFGTAPGNEHGVLFQLINTSTGAVTLNREVFFDLNDNGFIQYNFQGQEDTVQHFGLHKRGTQYVLTYLSYNGWREVELSAGTAQNLSDTFATDCDVRNLAIGPNLSTVYFHAEYGCFGHFPGNNELLLRCDTLYAPNPNGAIDDRGTTEGNEIPQ